MNYISISQRLAAVTFFDVLASLCNIYGSIFLTNEICFLDQTEQKLVSQENVKIYLFKKYIIS